MGRSCRPSRTPPRRTRSGAWRRPASRSSPTASSASRASRPTRSPTRSPGTGLADNLAGDGQFFAIFDDGHHRQLPRLTGGPFRYKTFASEFVEKNRAIATHPVKQAVIAPSMLMLLYPLEGEIAGYSRDQFLDDLCDEVEKDIRAVLRRRRRARLDRLHRGPAGEQERLAQPLDQQGHAPGVHRPQQPRDRPLQRRGAGQHRHPHLPRRRLRLACTPRKSPTRSC